MATKSSKGSPGKNTPESLVDSVPNAKYAQGDNTENVSPFDRQSPKGKITTETGRGSEKNEQMKEVPSKPSFSNKIKSESSKGDSLAPKAVKPTATVPLEKTVPPTVTQENKVPHTQEPKSMRSKVLNMFKKHKLNKDMGGSNLSGDAVSSPSLAMSQELKKEHIGFKKLEGKLSHQKGVTNPGALAAAIGRKKYGEAGMEAKSKAGMKKHQVPPFESKMNKSDNDGTSDPKYALSQLDEVMHHVNELKNLIAQDPHLENWIQGKLSRASSDLSDATHAKDGDEQESGMSPEQPMQKTGMKKNVVVQSPTVLATNPNQETNTPKSNWTMHMKSKMKPGV